MNYKLYDSILCVAALAALSGMFNLVCAACHGLNLGLDGIYSARFA